MSKRKGLKFDCGKPRMDLVSSIALRELAKVLTFGAIKYDSHNWRKGIKWSRIIASIFRHLTAYNSGEDCDPETGLSHMSHVLCNAMFLVEYEKTQKKFDDRYRSVS